ncbi:MAG: MFS transporter [Cyclobacteriaceae bacterium]
MKLNDKKTVNAWCMYDWANSVYSLVITSTIFPVYYNEVTREAFNGDRISFFGMDIENTVLYSYSISFSFLVVALLSPLLSGIADYSGRKKSFMKFFTFLGSFSCIALFFFEGPNVEFGIIASVLASIGYGGAIVFYNAYLPEIVSPNRYDLVSARGFSYGYVGSVILMVLNIVLVTWPDFFGIEPGSLPAKISFLLVGIWWLGFAQITFSRLPDNVYKRRPDRKVIKKGYQELKKVWNSLSSLPTLKKYLLAFFFYSAGVQTTMYLAATFGEKELELPTFSLILTILIIQIVAIAGSYFFAFISKFRGNRFSLIMMVIIWICICVAAYFIYSEAQFYVLAFVVGLVMGGIQALSRATYAKLIPYKSIDHASYFSFYDVTEKMSTVVGTFAYALVEQITQSMRLSALTLGLFFVIGFGFLLMIRIPRERSRIALPSEEEVLVE